MYTFIIDRLLCQVIVTGQMIPPPRAYVLGAAFGAKVLEDMFRPVTISKFHSLITKPQAEENIRLLADWCPEKVFRLVKDVGISPI